jgi:hypothetical protein
MPQVRRQSKQKLPEGELKAYSPNNNVEKWHDGEYHDQDCPAVSRAVSIPADFRGFIQQQLFSVRFAK